MHIKQMNSRPGTLEATSYPVAARQPLAQPPLLLASQLSSSLLLSPLLLVSISSVSVGSIKMVGIICSFHSRSRDSILVSESQSLA